MNTSSSDVRWRQRFSNFKKALIQLEGAVELSHQRELTQLEKQGVIQAFEFTHELAWNVLQDFLEDQGEQHIRGSKDATRAAFKVSLITDGEQWMAMIQSRNVSSHTYDEKIAELLVAIIFERYFPLFKRFESEMETLQLGVAENKKNRFGLSPITLHKLEGVFNKYAAIESVVIYGSRAKGNYKRGSDIDLTIKGDLFSFSELMQIESDIDDLYLPYQVDLSQYDALGNSDLLDHINRVGITIYSKRQLGDV